MIPVDTVIKSRRPTQRIRTSLRVATSRTAHIAEAAE